MGVVASGRLNRRIRIERLVESQDTLGQPVRTWEHVVTVWGDVKVLTGMGAARNELHAGGNEVARTTTSIRIRRRAGITHGMRAVIAGREYDIRDVLYDVAGNEFIDLACMVGANEGG
jgi:SPP1 family predicted phage head-tail adaptor